jgi:type II restriction/modification system DNA methylase subunit YeeA
MNKTNLKSYAPQARKDFIAAVTARANQLGLSVKAGSLEVAPAQTQGDVTVIAGQAWPSKVSGQRDKLIESIRKDGFEHTMEAVAYTWFNRFAALRYMELHDYLGHGHRALSSTAGGLPDILTHATDLSNDLPGLNAAKVTELKLAGNRDGELYRMLLVAQCNALSRTMPFLFERIDDDSELLLPDNLLRSDSVIAKLVEAIPEEDWAEVEIIGWLYQFYISEKKDQVIGKVVKSEDIPAATQLFTPNWIVQYMVQNSVGRLWLMANPQSTLAKEWPYYITPAEQTPEVQAQLDALIQTRVREDGKTLNPESITVLDPACGSGHILVVAYDVLKSIYLERGYQPRAIPRLILEKNLYGLDIDDRAVQMACFALLMKARADDRRLFTGTDEAGNLQPPKLNVLSLQESKGLSVDELTTQLATHQVQRATITSLVDTFENAKTFGSLIKIPYAIKTHLAVLHEVLTRVKKSGDMYATAAAEDLIALVHQAQVLTMRFDAVVANPPFMGRKFFEQTLKTFLSGDYAHFDGDIFSAFIVRNIDFTKEAGFLGFMSPMVWMFISVHEPLRKKIINETNFASLIQLEYNASGEVRVPLCTFTIMRSHLAQYAGTYIRLTDFSGNDNQGPKTLEAIANPDCGWFFVSRPDDFEKIPGSPLAYWVSKYTFESFNQTKIGEIANVSEGVKTGDNARFLRLWHEVSVNKSSLLGNTKGKWRPHHKGGDYRRWYGNLDFVINWEDDGKEIRTSGNSGLQGKENYFLPGVTWSKLSSSYLGVRLLPEGVLFDSGSPAAFPLKPKQLFPMLGLMSSNSASYLCKILNPTLNFQVGNISSLPFPNNAITRDESQITDRVVKLIEISKTDWDSYETSWNFTSECSMFPISASGKLRESFNLFENKKNLDIAELINLEVDNNLYFSKELGLLSDVSPSMSEQHMTLRHPNRVKDSQRLVSYAIGCMMGRYSLNEPGLIYAHAGNVGFEPGRYATFPADSDGIAPITDELWFADDAPSRISEFLRVVWGPDTLKENMAWLAESLGTKASETPDETIRRYIADKFFKDHLQTYKKRPIYWLFSSGKQGAFQALVYLHRYHEGTLARLRAEYVVPLTGKIQSRIEMLQKDAAAATSTAARNKLAKEVEKLKKKHVELLAYDEQLRHYADMRITLDLDDGVKVNYGKFGDLLAEVKAVTGGASDD